MISNPGSGNDIVSFLIAYSISAAGDSFNSIRFLFVLVQVQSAPTHSDSHYSALFEHWDELGSAMRGKFNTITVINFIIKRLAR